MHVTRLSIHYSSSWASTNPTHISGDKLCSWICFPPSIEHLCLSHRKNARGTLVNNKSRKTSPNMKWLSWPKTKTTRPLNVGATSLIVHIVTSSGIQKRCATSDTNIPQVLSSNLRAQGRRDPQLTKWAPTLFRLTHLSKQLLQLFLTSWTMNNSCNSCRC